MRVPTGDGEQGQPGEEFMGNWLIDLQAGERLSCGLGKKGLEADPGDK